MPWLAAALLAGCATGDLPPEPKRETPAVFRNAPASAELPRPRADWWREFGSEELNRLEETALANNRDHRIAIARVAQAQAQAGLAAAGRWPNVDAIVRREGYAPAGGPGSVVEGGEYKPANRIRVGFRASYEADLWGKLGYAADSALALADASEFHRQTVALTLTSDLAAAYFEYLSFAARAGVAGARSPRSSSAWRRATRPRWRWRSFASTFTSPRRRPRFSSSGASAPSIASRSWREWVPPT